MSMHRIFQSFSDRLVEGRISVLDGYLAPSLQSVLFESIVWTVGYLAYAAVGHIVLRSLWRHRRFWYTAHKRGGTLTHNAQDELPAFLLTALQHMVGGLLMAAGVILSDSTLWRHGYLIETGYEAADLISMAMKLPPYDHGVKEELIVPIICHHIPGIVNAAVLLESGLHENPHLRSIGMWLLLAGGVSLLCAFYINVLDFDKNMSRAAVIQTANISFFVWARFVMFPRDAYNLICDVRADSGHGTFVLRLLYFSAGFFGVFNTVVLIDTVPKTIRYVQRALDGVTQIDDKPVPPPKEGKMKQRRSSVARALSRMTHVADNVQRNSLSNRRLSKRLSAVLLPDPILAARSFDGNDMNGHGGKIRLD